MKKIILVTSTDCSQCEKVKKIMEEIKRDFPQLQIKEIDMTTEKGMQLVQKYQIMSSPGVIINGKLFSVGGADKSKLIKKLKSS